MNNEEFLKDVSDRFYKGDYRPGLVIVAHKDKKVLFVKSAKSGVWNLPQEGIHNDEGISDAFLRGWAEELCNINFKDIADKNKEKIIDRIKNEYFPNMSKYEIFHTGEAITPGRSREGFSGKKYYFVEAEYAENEEYSIEKLNLNPDEIADIEWVSFNEARILMISSGVAFKKRGIVEQALDKLRKKNKIE